MCRLSTETKRARQGSNGFSPESPVAKVTLRNVRSATIAAGFARLSDFDGGTRSEATGLPRSVARNGERATQNAQRKCRRLGTVRTQKARKFAIAVGISPTKRGPMLSTSDGVREIPANSTHSLPSAALMCYCERLHGPTTQQLMRSISKDAGVEMLARLSMSIISTRCAGGSFPDFMFTRTCRSSTHRSISENRII